MGFLGNLIGGVMKNVAVRMAFERGQRGEPPLVNTTDSPEIQALYDKAYEQGRQSVLNKTIADVKKGLSKSE
jgi:hypothetical protein